MKSGWVSACLPVFNTGKRLLRTIDSVLEQTYAKTQVIVSVDGHGSDAETIGALSRYIGNPRVRVIYQTEQLGWVENMNRAFHEADTEFYFYLDHDDHIAPNYVELLVAALRENSSTVNCYGSVEWFGAAPGQRDAPPSLVGPAKERVKSYLGQSLHALPMSGLTRRCALERGAGVSGNICNGLAGDIPYVLRLASLGNCVLVPDALYYKYRGKETISAGWAGFPAEHQFQALANIGTQIYQIVFEILPADDAREVILCWLPELCRVAVERSGVQNSAMMEALTQDLILRITLKEWSSSPVDFAKLATVMSDPIAVKYHVAQKLAEAAIHRSSGSWLAAAASYEVASQIDPGSKDAYMGLALSLEQIGSTEKAISAAQSALQLDGQSIDALACIARQRLALEDLSGAETAALRICQLDPAHEGALAMLEHVRCQPISIILAEAANYRSSGSWLAAAASYEAASRIDPGSEDAYLGLALSLEQIGSTEKALCAARSALQLHGDSLDALACVARQCITLEDLAGAETAALHICQLDPSHQGALAMLKFISHARRPYFKRLPHQIFSRFRKALSTNSEKLFTLTDSKSSNLRNGHAPLQAKMRINLFF